MTAYEALGIYGFETNTVDDASIGGDWCLMSFVMNMEWNESNDNEPAETMDHDALVALAETMIRDNFFGTYDFVRTDKMDEIID